MSPRAKPVSTERDNIALVLALPRFNFAERRHLIFDYDDGVYLDGVGDALGWGAMRRRVVRDAIRRRMLCARVMDYVERGFFTGAANLVDEALCGVIVTYDWAQANSSGLDSLRSRGVEVDTSDTEYVRLIGDAARS